MVPQLVGIFAIQKLMKFALVVIKTYQKMEDLTVRNYVSSVRSDPNAITMGLPMVMAIKNRPKAVSSFLGMFKR